MKANLNNIWWMLLVRGLLLLVFGFIAILWPGLTFTAFVLAFAIYIIAAGVINIVASIGGIGRMQLWFLNLILGIFEVGVGVYAVKNPGITAAALIVLVGLTFVVRGILEMVAAFTEDLDGRNRGLFTILGLLSLAAGVIIWLYPVGSALAFTWILGIYALVGGPLLIALGIEAKAATNELTRRA
jgi:uncharacterized membrane protein HdeD (DUF308 family)